MEKPLKARGWFRLYIITDAPQAGDSPAAPYESRLLHCACVASNPPPPLNIHLWAHNIIHYGCCRCERIVKGAFREIKIFLSLPSDLSGSCYYLIVIPFTGQTTLLLWLASSSTNLSTM
jgi:hypothetical protein